MNHRQQMDAEALSRRAFWLTVAGVVAFLAGLFGWPYYSAWRQVKQAEVEIKIEQVQGRCERDG